MPALQFHLEVGMDDIECRLRQSPGELGGGGAHVMTLEQILDTSQLRLPAVHTALVRLLDGFGGT
ncbi:MAG TPA: hypothetical protein VLL97_12335 [Acidobacteriota bacterium]|nr:hypothetical protein [Acidobacteriota bacterium]